jgi:hypothetical protein
MDLVCFSEVQCSQLSCPLRAYPECIVPVLSSAWSGIGNVLPHLKCQSVAAAAIQQLEYGRQQRVLFSFLGVVCGAQPPYDVVVD